MGWGSFYGILAMPKAKIKGLSKSEAIDRMKLGAVLCTQHGSDPMKKAKTRYWLEPGGETVWGDVVKDLIRDRKIKINNDGLFAGHNQTWVISE